MKRLIITSSSGLGIMRSELADAAVMLPFRFVPGPSLDNLGDYVAARSEAHGPGSHWSDFGWRNGREVCNDLALIEFCEPYEIIELWFDPAPNDQLELICWLDFFRSHPEAAAKLKLRLIGFDLITADERRSDWTDVPIVRVRTADMEVASASWQAYRATTPEACFDLLRRDLSAFPMLRPALLDLLQELPWSATGLGATEMRLLELISTGFTGTNALFYLRGFRQRGVFNDWEIGTLLEGLAHCPKPAVAGLDEELRTLSKENYRGRLRAFQRSRLSLTKFGEEILANKEDFSRHNPIDRWWGGTRLTNDRLWRWSPALMMR
jgi:hypothetical protein